MEIFKSSYKDLDKKKNHVIKFASPSATIEFSLVSLSFAKKSERSWSKWKKFLQNFKKKALIFFMWIKLSLFIPK